ncbi:AMP-binding protein [Catenovulum sp. 2E275]|uniref:AMP-binding protein n=1 Tax=Catenovulum sp. 2E275 TaxID=2980497 RepID=UPI0021D2ED12|nr:AMP-binding protein [Catenovulum sp. 2E275]MCU4674751.1 AMP-binding protein [Catenovulum sp. 2E275]
MQGFCDNNLAIKQGFIFDAESQTKLSYFELNQKIEDLIHTFPEGKFLYAVKANNSLAALITYLALLRSGQCILLLDPNLNAEQKQTLLNQYQVEFLFDLATTESDKQLPQFIKTGYQSDIAIHADINLLLSTSGSTASPKLVKLSLKNLAANCESILAYLPVKPDDTQVCTLPMHYSFGLSVLHTHLQQGANIVLNNFSLMQKPFWELIKTYRPQGFYGVPFSYQLLTQLGLKRLPLDSFSYFAQAGGKMPLKITELMHSWCAELHKPLFIMYGQTEATARIAYLKPEILAEKMQSIGQAIQGGKLKLCDEAGREIVQAQTIGELYYSGDNVCLGLAENRADLANIEAIDWLATGDLAKFDQEGDFYITGRLKRFIKITGKRISLDEVEQIFASLLTENQIQTAYSVVGQDDRLLLVVTDLLDDEQQDKLVNEIAGLLAIHQKYVQLKQITVIPRLSNGKCDYPEINRQCLNQDAVNV